MKTMLALAALGLMIPTAANAGCVGTGNLKTCYDKSGNSYTVNKIGNSTYVNGFSSQTGNTWSQQSYKSGTTTQTYGQDAKGRSWNQTNTRTSTYGTDADGNAYYVPSYSNPYDPE